MPVQLPYLSSYKNVPTLFEKIATAKVPDSFTHGFLQNTIGLKNTTDRPLIPFLRSLGFIDSSGKPTQQYSLLKGGQRKAVLADGIRIAYRPLFDADEEAYQHTGERLRSLSYTCGSLAGSIAAVKAGLGVTVLPKDMVPPGLETFDGKQLPDLEDTEIALLEAPRVSAAAKRLGEHIVRCLEQGPSQTN